MIWTPRRDLILPKHLRQKQGGFLLNPFRFGGSAFPAIAATNTGTNGTSNTTGTVQLPSGIVSGNLLIVHAGFGTSTSSRTMSGWTEFGTGLGFATLFYRIADGTEGSTATMSWTTSANWKFRSVRITGNHGSAAPEAVAAANTLDGSTVTPSWGANSNLYIAFAGRATNIDGYPSNMPDNQATTLTGGAAPSTAIASANSSASSFDPAVFGTDSGTRTTFSVAVRPA